MDKSNGDFWIWPVFMPSVLQASVACGLSARDGLLHRWIDSGAAFTAGHNRLRVSECLALVQESTQMTLGCAPHPYFPTELAKYIGFGDLSDLQVLMLSCANVKEALTMSALATSFVLPTMQHQWGKGAHSSELSLTHRPPFANWKETWGMTECVLVYLARFFRELGVDAFRGARVSLQHPTHARAKDLADALGCSTTFGQPGHVIRFDHASLRMQLPTAHPTLKRMAHERIRRFWLPRLLLSGALQVDSHLDSPVTMALNKLLNERPEAIHWSLGEAAHALNASPRTLQRQLKLAGSSWRDVVQRAQAGSIKHLAEAKHLNPWLIEQMLPRQKAR